MKHFRPLNRKAHAIARARTEGRVEAHSCSSCCMAYSPGWEIADDGTVDPCPWQSDLWGCWASCFWAGQVPDATDYPSWMDCCGKVDTDWTCFCTVPD